MKELPVSSEPLTHTHVHFAHCYKEQAGWEHVLARFHAGKGTLYDLEFLQDESGRRVAAFGFHAGFAGAAAGLLAYAALQDKHSLGKLEPFANETAMLSALKTQLKDGTKDVKVLVMGALGRCGRGAVDLLRKVGVKECVYVYTHNACHNYVPVDQTFFNGIWQKPQKAVPFWIF